MRAVALPGGEQAIREPWRMALSHLLDAGEDPARLVGDVAPASVRVVRRMIETGLNAPPTTSVGRLFDAVAAMLGVRRARVSFEGQAAMELEWLAGTSDAREAYPFELESGGEDGYVVDTRPLVRAVSGALRRGGDASGIARRFHASVVEMTAVVVSRLRDDTGIDDVVLSGGVFANELLLESAKRELEGLGLRVYTHALVPANDGGLSLGQLAIAAASLEGSG